MKVIVAPDKFKGSLTSKQVCDCINKGVLQKDKNADIHLFPMADGGDGFAAVMKYYLQTETISCETVDPLLRRIDAAYEWDAKNRAAVIELASASGLVLLDDEEKNPLYTSTYGTGLIIKEAIDKGAEKIILGLGGSATNDAGIGILSALGFVFKDGEAKELKPIGKNLESINTVITPPSIPSIEFTIATDVSNVLFGKDGAAFVFAAQKGADEKTIADLDKGLQHFAAVIEMQTGKDIANFNGSGAAGGVAAGLSAFFKTEIVSGAGLIISVSKMEDAITNADIIITGEGKLDDQTRKGKVIHQIATTGMKYNIPVVALCGEVCIDEQGIKAIGLQSAVSLVNESVSKGDAIKKAATLLEDAAASLFVQ